MNRQATDGSDGGSRRLAAIMFTDMVGFSSVAEKDEAGALSLLEVQSRLMEPILVVHGGRLVRTMGDGAFVEFGSAVSACKAALEIQAAVAKHSESGAPFQNRIGIHLGDVEVADGDLLGHGVNVVARIETLAEPGGVCISEDVARQVKGKIGADLDVLGERHLKGIERGINVYRLTRPKPLESKPQPAKRTPSIAVLRASGTSRSRFWRLSSVRPKPAGLRKAAARTSLWGPHTRRSFCRRPRGRCGRGSER